MMFQPPDGVLDAAMRILGESRPADVVELAWFRDAILDYEYSPHLLEDFEDPARAPDEWSRVLRPGVVACKAASCV